MSIGDVGDVSTWKFDGKSFDRAAVVATVQAALAAEVDAVIDPLIQIRADIGRLRTDVDALKAGAGVK